MIEKQLVVGDIRYGSAILPKDERQTIILLADDLRHFSGIATMARSIVTGTCHRFNWIQVAGAIQHRDNGKIIDISQSITELTGVPDASVKLFCTNGYGSPDIVRDILSIEKPAAILFYTDPRFWTWLFNIEHEVRQLCPMLYYNVWDELPYPDYNRAFYQSCDAIFNISKQTVNIVNQVLRGKTVEIDLNRRRSVKNNVDKNAKSPHVYEDGQSDVMISYIPHGIDSNDFKPINENEEWFQGFKRSALGEKEYNFVILYNSRNIRRKSTSDLLTAYKIFCSKLSPDDREKTVLLLKTDVVDPNGTDLYRFACDLLPECEVRFVAKDLNTSEMAALYNLADVQVCVSSAEGFGLSCAEAIMCGVPVIATVTGGLQDQMRFEDESGKWTDLNVSHPSNTDKKYSLCGQWAFPVWPDCSNQGSPPTPYIYDSRPRVKDIVERLLQVRAIDKSDRRQLGMAGREWMMGNEAMMSAECMAKNFICDIERAVAAWSPRKRFSLFRPVAEKPLENKGIYNPTDGGWL